MTQKINEQSEINELTQITAEEFEINFMQQCEARAAELARKYNTPKVYVYVGVAPDGSKVVGYIKEPSYIQKIVALDKIATVGMFMAADELRESLTLKDESDPRTYLTSPDCDAYRLGMTGTCATMIEVVSNTFKKK